MVYVWGGNFMRTDTTEEKKKNTLKGGQRSATHP